MPIVENTELTVESLPVKLYFQESNNMHCMMLTEHLLNPQLHHT